MTKTVMCVATGHYVVGQQRLRAALPADVNFVGWADCLPPGSPTHAESPYGFKAHGVASDPNLELLLWADASILPIRDLGPLWDLIEKQGYWFSNNGWNNGQWCSDAALPLLGITREEAFSQNHVVAGTFGLNLRSPIGQAFRAEYLRFERAGAFRGPWTNKNGEASADPRVLGHRHDQTACSVIAHRLGMKLTDPPEWFAYKGGETEKTVLVADGNY